MKRRDFIEKTALAGGSWMIMPSFYDLSGGSQKHIGLQLYTVRDLMNKDVVDTISRIGKIGYTEVEGFGYDKGKLFGLEPSQFVAVLKGSGIVMPSIHHIISRTSWNDRTSQLTDIVKQSLDTFAALGVKLVVCPFILQAQRSTESVRKLADIFNQTGDYCRKSGMRFGYHNHDFEFTVQDQTTIYDILVQRTDARLVQFELDIYWAVYAGQNPIDLMKKANGRVTALHVKDMANNRKTVEIGEGMINLAEIFAAPETAQVQYYFIELEHFKRTPLEGSEISYRNLKTLLNV